MDPAFLERLERQARAKQGLPTSWTDEDISMHPPPLSLGSNSSDHSAPHPPGQPSLSQDDDSPDDDDGDDDGDDDEILRVIGEAPEEMDDLHRTNLELLVPIHQRSTPRKESDELAHPTEEAEDEEDDATTDSEEGPRPKKPEAIPTIRLTLALPTQLPTCTIERSVSLLAKNAGYTLPADTAITLGASSVPEPELPQSHLVNPDTSLDMPPPPKRRRRRRIQERDEGYDKDDPFVDDSEAFIMEPKYYCPPARDGFFAATGRLELKSGLRKSKTRKSSNKAPQIDPPKPKRRVPLTTLPESSSTLGKTSTSTQNPVHQTPAKGTNTTHPLLLQSQNPIQEIKATGAVVDPQLTSKSPSSVKQTQSKGTSTHPQTTVQSTNPVQQALSKGLDITSQPTCKSSNPTQQTEDKGPNKILQSTSVSQNPHPLPQTQINGSTANQYQTPESQNLAHQPQCKTPTINHDQTWPKAPTVNHPPTSKPRPLIKYALDRLAQANHQADSQSQNSTQQTQAKASDLSHNPVSQSPNQGQPTWRQPDPAQQAQPKLPQTDEPKPPQANEGSSFPTLLPMSTPNFIKNETESSKAQPQSQTFKTAHATPSQASPQPVSGPYDGTPLNPISLIDEDDISTSSVHPPPFHQNQSLIITSSPGPSNQTHQLPRPPYLKSRSLPERKTAGPLPQVLEQALEQLQAKVNAASPFVPKKFPPELKPLTLDVAQLALDLNEYDECFFIRLAHLFPYNTFTIKKFVKREILPRRKAYYEEQINQRIKRLEEMIAEGMPSARADHEMAMEEYRQMLPEYEKRQEARKKYEQSLTALPANASTILGDTVTTTSPFNVFKQKCEVPEKIPKPPNKTYIITQPMREILYELAKLEDEQSETVKDTQKIVDKNVPLKDTNNRRQFYARLAHLWPDDFMTTARISHIVGAMKKKLEGNPAVEPQNIITLS